MFGRDTSVGWLVVPLVLAVIVSPAARGDPPDAGSRAGEPATFPPSVPAGFLIEPVGTVPTPTSLTFSPDGDTLYVASFAGGSVSAFPVLGGVALGPPVPFLDGLNTPLGVLATADGVFVSVVVNGAGAVLRAADTNGDRIADTVDTVISGLPIGRHNTNGMAIGPDGMLYVTNGNSTDSGFRAEGGPPEQQPFSGSLLRVDPAATNLTPDPSMVVATGWRNIYDVAFVPRGHPRLPAGMAAVPMNGPDGVAYEQPDGTVKQRPAGEDTLSLFDVTDGVVEHFGFPWCLYDRDNGALRGFAQDPEEGVCDPLPPAASAGLAGPVEASAPAALFGLHVSADGLAFNPDTQFPEDMNGDLFVAQFGNFFGDETVGHKIVRVRFTERGNKVEAISDFMTGGLPLDLTFGPDGSMWVADFGGHLLRVASVL